MKTTLNKDGQIGIPTGCDCNCRAAPGIPLSLTPTFMWVNGDGEATFNRFNPDFAFNFERSSKWINLAESRGVGAS